jgi:hypothetical protein
MVRMTALTKRLGSLHRRSLTSLDSQDLIARRPFKPGASPEKLQASRRLVPKPARTEARKAHLIQDLKKVVFCI